MATKSVRLTIKNDRIRAIEERQDRLEQLFLFKLDEFGKSLQGLKDNELEHIYGEMQEMQLAQTALRAEIRGSIKMLKWIIGIILGLLPALVKIVDMVLK